MAEPEDINEIYERADMILRISPEEYNEIMGFMGYDKQNRFIVFKVKNTTKKRNTGAKCLDKTNSDRLLMLNETIGENKFIDKNEIDISAEERANGMIPTKRMGKAMMCAVQEFMMRYYNKTKKNGKIWFLNFELAMLYKL
jgi:hypothetical protein